MPKLVNTLFPKEPFILPLYKCLFGISCVRHSVGCLKGLPFTGSVEDKAGKTKGDQSTDNVESQA